MCLRACAKCTDSDSSHAWAKSHHDIFSPLIHSSVQWFCLEHAQNVRIHIIQRMSKISSGPLLSNHTFYSIQWFCEVKALIRQGGCAGCSGPPLSAHAQRYVFAWHGPILHRKDNSIFKKQTRYVCVCKTLCPQLYTCRYKMPKLKRDITLTKADQRSPKLNQIIYTLVPSCM